MTNVYKTNMCSACCRRGGRHKETCIYQIGQEGIDYVKCQECQHKGKSLSGHLRKIHSLTAAAYLLKHPTAQIQASKTTIQRSAAQTGRDNWVKVLKGSNPQLAALMIKNMSRKVSESILKNPAERERRSQGMKALWRKHDAYFRRVASEAAIKTSQRQDVLDNRTAVLRKWREENPQVFYERCTAQMVKMRSSKPEKALAGWLIQTFPNLGFRHSQRLYHVKFTTVSKQRLIDVLSKENKIVVEFDGPVHFKNIPSWNQLEEVQRRDNEVNELLKGEYAVVRVSCDQWHAKRGFRANCLSILQTILSSPDSYRYTVTKIGGNYND